MIFSKIWVLLIGDFRRGKSCRRGRVSVGLGFKVAKNTPILTRPVTQTD